MVRHGQNKLTRQGSGSAAKDRSNGLSLRKYPKLRRILPIIILSILLWYGYSCIWAAHSHGSSLLTQPTCVPHSGNDVSKSIIIVDSLSYDKLRTIGGTGHWFHLLERVIPALPLAARTAWLKAYASRGDSNNKDNTSLFKKKQQYLYIIFQDAAGAEELDSFGRLILSSILSGGYYDKVLLGYTYSDVKTFVITDDLDKRIEIADISDFKLTASLLFHPEEDIAYSELLSGEVDHHVSLGETTTFTSEDPPHLRSSNTVNDHSTICAHVVMTLTWDLAPSKLYDLMGNDSTIYDLLHSSVDRACGWETNQNNGADGTSLFYGSKQNSFEKYMKSINTNFRSNKHSDSSSSQFGGQEGQDGYYDDNTLFTNEYGAPLDISQVQGQMLQSGLFPIQDELSLPSSARFTRKLTKYRSNHCTVTSSAGAGIGSCNGTDIFMRGTNTAGLKVVGWKQYSSAHISQRERDDGTNNVYENESHFKEIKNILEIRSKRFGKNYTIAGSKHAEYDTAAAAASSREFILPQVPVATDVPLTVLVYDRDRTRRLTNVDAIVGYLRKNLPLIDDNERHSYFPLYYSDDKAPKALPKQGLGTIGSVAAGREKSLKRRKGGRHVHDASNNIEYGHNGEKDNWVIDVITHNNHDAHNQHVHISGVSGKPFVADKESPAVIKAEAELIRKKKHKYNKQQQKLQDEEAKWQQQRASWHKLGTNEVIDNMDTTSSTGDDDYNGGAVIGNRKKKAFGNGRRLGWIFSDDDEKGDKEEAGSGMASYSDSNVPGSKTTTTHHPACDLIRSVKESTVLITPHGFQSILLLFQPKKSLFIEIMPFGYHKPEIFGFIQAGLRSIPLFGEFRSYMVHESHPTTIFAKILHFVGLRGEQTEEDKVAQASSSSSDSGDSSSDGRWWQWNQSKCTGLAACRHLVRDQDLVVDEKFLRRVVEFIKTHYVSNRNVRSGEFFG
jgi:hypothetical protein